MKKIFTLLTVLMFGFATLSANADTYQQAPAATQHVRKNGMPDKRYKDNSAATSQHMKKNGTPDMRYKSNNSNAGKSSAKKKM